jgi:hypothetical protein
VSDCFALEGKSFSSEGAIPFALFGEHFPFENGKANESFMFFLFIHTLVRIRYCARPDSIPRYNNADHAAKPGQPTSVRIF